MTVTGRLANSHGVSRLKYGACIAHSGVVRLIKGSTAKGDLHKPAPVARQAARCQEDFRQSSLNLQQNRPCDRSRDATVMHCLVYGHL